MKIGCFTCKYGYEDERLGIPLCHHPKRFSEDCVNFNMHEEKETEESEKPINLDDAMKELDEKIALVKERGTWDGVDVDKYMDEVRGREPEKPMGQEKEVKPCHKTRKKLAEWSKTQEGRESYEKVAEEMRKQIVPKDLEEAARKSAVAPFNLDVDEEHLYEYPYLPIAEQKFIEGAKWQAEHAPLPEDTVLFNKGVEEGRRLAEEEQADLFTIVALDAAQRAKGQMMREAVEGEVLLTPYPTICLDDCKDYDFKDGQKVRIIIVKED